MVCNSKKTRSRSRRVLVAAIASVVMSQVLAMSSPVHATTLADGTYACSTGTPSSDTPNYTITSGVVLAGSGCIGDVVIPSGVTSIGDIAFQWSAMESITIPEGVTVIGEAAFDGTPNLTSITIPASVTQLRNYVFAWSNITTVNFAAESQLTVIGIGAFERTPNLTSITIPASVTQLLNNVFTYSAITTVNFAAESQLTYIGSTFFRAGNLSSLIIPDGVTELGQRAFAATALTSVRIPSGVTAISEGLFEETSTLTSVTMPAGVEWIGGQAFAGTTNLTSIEIPSGVTYVGSYAFAYSGITTIALPDGLQHISRGLFLGSGLTSVTIPAGVQSIGTEAFSQIPLSSVTFAEGGQLLRIYDDAFSGTPNLTSIDIPSSVISIGSGAFYSSGISTVTIPSGVTTLEPQTFRSATNLSRIVFADNSALTSIGDDVFMFANSLTSISIPSGVISIGNQAFYHARSLVRVNFLGDAPTVGVAAFEDIGPSAKGYKTTSATGFSSSLGELSMFDYPTVTFDANGGSGGTSTGFIIGDSIVEPTQPTRAGHLFTGWFVAETGGSAINFPYAHGQVADFTLYAQWESAPTFACSSGLSAVGNQTYRILDGVVSDGNSCVGAVVIPPGVTSIGNNAFYGALLSSISIPASVTSIGDGSFRFTDALASVTFAYGSQLTSIGDQAFEGAISLTSISIPASVTSIGDGSFRSTDALASVTFAYGSQLTSIGDQAFFMTGNLTSITFPAGATSIGSYAFAQIGSLVRVNFLGDAPTVGEAAFEDIGPSAKGYKTTSATGFTESLGELSILNYPTVTFDANGGSGGTSTGFIIGGSVDEPANPTRTGFGFAGWSESDGGSAVSFPFSPPGDIDLRLFALWTLETFGCASGLPSADGPTYRLVDGVVSEGSDCVGSVVIPAGAVTIAPYAFANSLLSSITFPAGLTLIGDNAFWNSHLVSVEIPHGVTRIEDSAFEGARYLTSVTFAAGSQLTSIGAAAFYFTIALTSITIPAGVTSIEHQAFEDARSLTSITIPASVTSIESRAFANAYSLVRVNFLGDAPASGGNAFNSIAPSAKGYKTPSAKGFSTSFDGLDILNYPTVTFDMNGGLGGSSTRFTIGDSIVGPTQPTRTGYSFAGWFVARSGGSAIVFPFAHGESSDFTVYAQWTANTLTVTFDSREGSSVSAGSSVTGGSVSSPGSPTRAGYSFAGWFVARSGGSAIVFPFAHGESSDFTVYAQWTASPAESVSSPPAESVSSPPAESVSSPPISQSKPSVVAITQTISIKTGKKSSFTSLAKKAKMSVPSGAKVSGTVSTASKSVCKVSGANVVGVTPGKCKITVTVRPKKGKTTKKSLSINIVGSPTLKRGASITLFNAVAAAGLSTSSESSVASLEASSSKLCKVSGAKIVAVKAGRCSMSVTVMSSSDSSSTMSLTIKVV